MATHTGGGNQPGRAVAARRAYLGKTGDQVEVETSGAIYPKLLSQIETGKRRLDELPANKLRALLHVLQWTNREFTDATGIPVGIEPDPLPDSRPYEEGVFVPIYASVSAGLSPTAGDESVTHYLGLDPSLPGVKGRPASRLRLVPVNGTSMVSPHASTSVPPGSMVLVEVGTIPQQDDMVVAYVEEYDAYVLKKYNEGPEVVLTSLNPVGPVFRASEVTIDVRGVVRLVLRKP